MNRRENLNLFCFLKALLLDIGADKSLPHISECESRPLIDLSNTPEVSKIASPKPVLSGQIKVSFLFKSSGAIYISRKMSTGCCPCLQSSSTIRII